MSNDKLKKRIVMIHGLNAKPPQKIWETLWQQYIIENIRVDDKDLAGQLDEQPELFLQAYWANATPHHIEDDANYTKKLAVQVDKIIKERRKRKGEFHVGTEEKIEAFFKGRGLDLVNLITGALTIKDNVMKKLFRETQLYNDDQYIADFMRQPLEEALRTAWQDGCDVALLSHSMGTFIAYDVLWRFSHRNVPGFKEFKKCRVQLFVTMGSPLGDSVIRKLLFSRYHQDKEKREYPTNIDFWHNYACLGDVVSHYHNFDEAFFKPMRKLRILPKNPAFRAIDYVNLHNPFEVVSHRGNKDNIKRDPHKSFGYLVQPQLGSWLADFLSGRLKYR